MGTPKSITNFILKNLGYIYGILIVTISFQVMYQKLFGQSLFSEKGSLPQLKVLINFRAKVDPMRFTFGTFESSLKDMLRGLHSNVTPKALI